jgi:hypothetical protein
LVVNGQFGFLAVDEGPGAVISVHLGS